MQFIKALLCIGVICMCFPTIVLAQTPSEAALQQLQKIEQEQQAEQQRQGGLQLQVQHSV
jgi:hypothetical protein